MIAFHSSLAQLTSSAAGQAAQDSVLVESPLPGGVATTVRFLLQTVPQWIQIWGFVAGVMVALGVLVYCWLQREPILRWTLTRSRGVKIAITVAIVFVVLAAAGASKVSWDYMQHDNGFCTGCHVMNPAFQRFTASEHDSLSCHDCHQQSVIASMRQLYLWVAERPGEIGEHSPVANAVCERCHVTGEPEVWQRIASTAGHRTHLESDSTSLDDVMCVTCHGQEVHQFVPVDSTCAQADCHVDSKIAMGAMQNQTSLHCVTCHQFAVEVPALATRDSAAGTLVPATEQCISCHEMQAILADFDPRFDPHSGSCGMCHKPHEQEVATAADQTCASANCHIDWRDEPFHVGTRHLDVGSQCTLCHEPHRARVDASDCQGCHTRIIDDPTVPRRIREGLQRIAPFDTTRALQRSEVPQLHRPFGVSWRADPDRPRGKGDVPPPIGPRPEPEAPIQLPVTPPDTFSHDQHAELSCLTCHQTETGHGALTFEAPRGCQICHHEAPATSDCAACHTSDELQTAFRAVVTVSVENAASRERPADFLHDQHADVNCVDCHTVPVTLVTTAAVATCADCHDDHHAAAISCVSCHPALPDDSLHAPPADAHRWCTDCHVEATVVRLEPDRGFCLSCHLEDGDHYPEKTCTVCHLQSTPDDFRGVLHRVAGER